MGNYYDVQNFRIITVSYIQPTNTRGARIKISEKSRFCDDKAQTKIFSFDYSISCIGEQAYNILKKNGWDIVGKGSTISETILFCNNWGEVYKEVKDLK